MSYSPLQAEAAKELLIRRRARSDILAYANAIEVPGKPASEDPDTEFFEPIETTMAHHHRFLLSKLDEVANTRHGRMMIFMPPGSAKSTYASVVFPSKFLGATEGRRLIFASYGDDLARKMGRRVRSIIKQPRYRGIFNTALTSESSAAQEFSLTNGSEYMSCGILGGVTGNRAHGIIIDDPIKGREQANSETIRNKCFDAYEDDLKTRLIPGGFIVIIQCMVGDTRVLLSNGSEKELRNIKVGDEVATYEDGKVTSSKVLNWMDQGSDNIFTVKTISRTVKANERHPFLVQSKTGELQWVRLRDLKPGDLLVSLKDAKNPQGQLQDRENAELAKQKIGITSKILNLKDKIRDIGGNAKVKLASLMNAPVLSTVLGCAKSIMGSIIGLTLERKERTSKKSGKDISSTDMGSLWINIMISLISKTAYAPFVDNLQQEKIHDYTGEISYASTTATTAERLEVYFATTATSQLDTQKLGKSPLQLLNISDFTVEEVIAIDPAGKEVVYDIQVERTENLVANGLVVSNTRWHEDDLSGRILPEGWNGESGRILCKDGNYWEVVCLAAKCESANDPLGRPIGEYLWREWFDDRHWAQFEQNPRTWAALFQQRPAPLEGDLFRPDQIKVIDALPAGDIKWCRGWDLASTTDGDYTAGGKLGRLPDGRFVIADMVRIRVGPDQRDAAMVNTAGLDGKGVRISIPQDPGQAGKTQVLYLTRALSGYTVKSSPESGDKIVRAEPFAAQVNIGNVMMLKGDFNTALINELRVFPNGTNDDQVDSLSRAFSEIMVTRKSFFG